MTCTPPGPTRPPWSAPAPLAFGAVVMGEDGLATGELREPLAMDLVHQLIPPLTRDQEPDLLRQALRLCAGFGITSVHNMDGDTYSLSLYRKREARGEMTVRIYHWASLGLLDVRRSADHRLA